MHLHGNLSTYVIYAHLNSSVIGELSRDTMTFKKRVSVSGCLSTDADEHITVSISSNSLLSFDHIGSTPNRRSISSDRTWQSPFVKLRVYIHLYPVQCCCWGVQCWAHSQRKSLRTSDKLLLRLQNDKFTWTCNVPEECMCLKLA